MLDRVLDELAQLALDLLQAANVLPRRVGHLDDSLAQRRRVRDAERVAEVLVRHGHRVKDLGVDRLLVDVDQVHLLADALHRRLGAERGDVRADKAVRLARDRLRVNVIVELHVARVDTEDLEAPVLVRHADVDLAVEAAKAAERRVDSVRPVRRADHDDGRALLEAVHERQQLRDDAALDLAVRLVALRRNRVDFVDEDDRGRVLLRLLERLAQVRLRLARHLRHDLRPVDEEKEGAGLVGDRARNQCLARAGAAVEQHAARRLDAERLEEGRVAQRQLDHFADLRHLLAAAANVVVADVVEALLVLALDGLALAVDHRVRRNDAVRRRVCLDDLELDRVHRLPHEEEVALAHRPVCLEEVTEDGSED